MEEYKKMFNKIIELMNKNDPFSNVEIADILDTIRESVLDANIYEIELLNEKLEELLRNDYLDDEEEIVKKIKIIKNTVEGRKAYLEIFLNNLGDVGDQKKYELIGEIDGLRRIIYSLSSKNEVEKVRSYISKLSMYNPEIKDLEEDLAIVEYVLNIREVKKQNEDKKKIKEIDDKSQDIVFNSLEEIRKKIPTLTNEQANYLNNSFETIGRAFFSSQLFSNVYNFIGQKVFFYEKGFEFYNRCMNEGVSKLVDDIDTKEIYRILNSIQTKEELQRWKELNDWPFHLKKRLENLEVLFEKMEILGQQEIGIIARKDEKSLYEDWKSKLNSIKNQYDYDIFIGKLNDIYEFYKYIHKCDLQRIWFRRYNLSPNNERVY